jgi:hypothetical protein
VIGQARLLPAQVSVWVAVVVRMVVAAVAHADAKDSEGHTRRI